MNIPNRDEIIVFVHALIRSKKSMAKLARDLQKLGYTTYLYGYPSMRYQINQHAAQFKCFLQNIIREHPNKKIHLVTHSLGGIIAREALTKISETDLNQFGCLIMLVPPNQGSALAKLTIQLFPFLAFFVKPLPELSSNPNAYVHNIGVPKKIKIGIIAAAYDVITPPSVTHLEGEQDFISINSTHNFILNNQSTKKAIMNFLQYARFDPNLL